MRPEDFLKINADNLSAIATATNAAQQGMVRASENHGKTLLALRELEERKQLEREKMELDREQMTLSANVRREEIAAQKESAKLRNEAYKKSVEDTTRARILQAQLKPLMDASKQQTSTVELQLKALEAERESLAAEASRSAPLALMNPGMSKDLAAKRKRIDEIDANRADLHKQLTEINRRNTEMFNRLAPQVEETMKNALPVVPVDDGVEGDTGPTGQGAGGSSSELPSWGEAGMDDSLIGELLRDEVIVPEDNPFSDKFNWIGIIPDEEPVMLRGVPKKGVNRAIVGDPRISAVIPAADLPEMSGREGDAPGEAAQDGYLSDMVASVLASVTVAKRRADLIAQQRIPMTDELGPTSYPIAPESTVHYEFPVDGVPLANFKKLRSYIDNMGEGKDAGPVKAEYEDALRTGRMRPLDISVYLTELANTNMLPVESVAQSAFALVDPKDPSTKGAAKKALEEAIKANSQKLQDAIRTSVLPDLQKTMIAQPAIRHWEKAARNAFKALELDAPIPPSNPALDAVIDVFKPKVVERMTGERWDTVEKYKAFTDAETARKNENESAEVLKGALFAQGTRLSKLAAVMIEQSDPTKKPSQNGPTPFGVRIPLYTPSNRKGYFDPVRGGWMHNGEENYRKDVEKEYSSYSTNLMLKEIFNVAGAPDPDRVKEGYESPNLAFDVRLNADGIPDPNGEWLSRTKIPGSEERFLFSLNTNSGGGDEFGEVYSLMLHQRKKSEEILRKLLSIKDPDARRKSAAYLFSEMAKKYANHKMNELR